MNKMELPSPADLLALYGRRAKKRYSQNFLIDIGILDDVAEVAGAAPSVRILEIGPGPGGLTTRLLARGASVRAVEADPMMLDHLHSAFPAEADLEVIDGDVLALDLEELIGSPACHVAANLPYSIATEILFRILDLDDKPRRMALMYQLEVAQRIAAKPGDRLFGMLGLSTMFHYHAVIDRVVKPGSFVPPPKVTSAIVGFRLVTQPLCADVEREKILSIGRKAFQLRRKMLRKSLKPLRADAEERLNVLGIDPRKRPEALDLDEWLRLGSFMDDIDGDAAL